MIMGIGYQEYRNKHKDIKNEKQGNERYLIYFGRAHVHDYLTNTLAKGPMKIGRGKFATALMRGRNQPGIDFRIYAEIIFDDNDSTFFAENLIKKRLRHKNLIMSQGQRELYNISDDELKDVVLKMVEQIKLYLVVNILEVNYFID